MPKKYVLDPLTGKKREKTFKNQGYKNNITSLQKKII